MTFETLHIPFIAGTGQKDHPYSLDAPKLLTCDNAVFDERGALKKRPGASVLPMTAFDSSDLSTGRTRALGSRDSELLLFARGYTFTYNEREDLWASRCRHEAVTVSQETVAHTRKDQYHADRAETNNVILLAWEDSGNGIAYQVIDKATGSVFETQSATTIGSATTPRCRAVGQYLHLYYVDASVSPRLLKVVIIDSNDVYGTAGGTPVTVRSDVAAASHFDVCEHTTTQTCVVYRTNSNTASYVIVRSSDGVVTDSNASVRTVGGALAIDFNADADCFFVARADSTPVVKYDRLDSALTDTADVDITVSADSPSHVAVAGRSTGAAWVLWDTQDGSYYRTNRAAVTNGGTVSGGDPIAHHCRLASKPFLWDDDGTDRYGVHLVYATGTLQTQFALIEFTATSDADIGLLARLLPGEGYYDSVTTWHLPQVEDVGSGVFAWAAPYRRQMKTEDNVYANPRYEVGLKTISYEFGKASAYRGTQLGDTLYLPGGYLAQYDGERVSEAGFWFYPESVTEDSTSDTGGSLEAAEYSYRFYWEWRNARGEVEKSTHAGEVSVDLTALADSNNSVTFTVPTLPLTRKDNVILAVYRTEATPGVGAVFYRCSSTNPTASTHVENDTSVATVSWTDDEFSDTELVENEIDYLSAGEIDNVPPPGAPQTIAQGQDRLFATHPERHNLVFYSKLRFDGETVAFNEELALRVPHEAGNIIAVEPGEDAIVILCEHGVYLSSGLGPDNTGLGGSYSQPQRIMGAPGCVNAESVVRCDAGIIYNSSRGFQLIDVGYRAKYIGADITDEDDRTIVAAVEVASEHQVLFFSTEGTLLYDYFVNQWSTWEGTPWNATHAVWARDTVHTLASDTVYKYDTSVYLDNTTAYSLIVETAWIKPNGPLGYSRVRWWAILGEFLSEHNLRIRVGFNYSSSWSEDVTQSNSGLSALTPEIIRSRLRNTKVAAVRFRIEDVDDVNPREEAFKLVGLALSAAPKNGILRLAASRSPSTT